MKLTTSIPTFASVVAAEAGPLRRSSLDTLQLNVGRVCNQACRHCHVDAGPSRTESLSAATAEQVLAFLGRSSARTLDITGGAPELNPQFRMLVRRARELGKHVMDRCNLTILQEPGQEDLGEFLAANQVEIVSSLPCYLESNVDKQRGNGVFDRSIQALKKLNAIGYGMPGSELKLHLVYNPVGTNLPPPQRGLADDYERELWDRFGIRFHELFTITNMPINRYAADLKRQGQLESYMQRLFEAFNAEAAAAVMCRTLLSVDYRGFLYDCDFNQMLDLPIVDDGGDPLHISRVTHEDFADRRIRVGDHCYGCTAGSGSSCGGALVQ
ncbi:MAG: arsenosugar biosynthesis radical SAM protein ArsS [Planctomycetota bacterium]